jgi:hypothetical protein
VGPAIAPLCSVLQVSGPAVCGAGDAFPDRAARIYGGAVAEGRTFPAEMSFKTEVRVIGATSWALARPLVDRPSTNLALPAAGAVAEEPDIISGRTSVLKLMV